MIRIAAQTGLRRGELSRIHSTDLVEDLMGASLRITGKGDLVRLVPLLEDLAELLIGLGEGRAFPDRTNGHLSPAHVGKLVSAALGPPLDRAPPA